MVDPPDAAYIKQRWIPRGRVEWVTQCVELMQSRGAVFGRDRYRTRDAARHHARALKRDVRDLRLLEEWQMIEHVEKVPEGWVWSIEYRGRSDDRARRTQADA